MPVDDYGGNMKVKFLGGGYFIGIPARDLTEDEWNAIPKKEQRMILKSGIYGIEIEEKKAEVKDNAG
jgi:hypothetical protein